MSETANHMWQTTVQPRVQSWMDHEDRCVTVQRLVQAFPSVSRWQASQWLQELASARPQACQITTCRQERTKEGDTPMTVFRLRQSTKVVATDGEEASVFAVASLEVTESVTTAHERDMVEWREMVADGRFHEVDAGAGVGAIASADAIRPLQHLVSDKQAVIAKPQTASNNNNNIIISSSNSNGGSSSHRHKAFAGKAKVTTAASFFGKSKSSDTAASSSETKKAPAVTTKKTVIPTTLKATAPRPTRAKENKRRTNQVAPAPENEKSFSNNNNNNNKKRNVGNADDFVADEEDSDDDEKEEETSRKASVPKQSRQEKAAAAAQRQAVEEANRESLQELPEDEDAEPAVRGAMDAFATKETKSKPAASDNSSSNQQSRHKKRRKKLVEKTTMVNGYLRTETQVVWEDVPSDEEEEEEEQAMARKKATAAKKAFGGNSSGKSSAQGMKQKSLMGFFAKK